MTLEHIILESLGGKLTCRFLCGECNSNFGTKLDARVKKDPLIRMAVHNLSSTLPRLARSYFEGQMFNVHAEGPGVRATYKKGTLKANARKLPDGTLIKHTPDARQQLERQLTDQGYSDHQIGQQLDRFDSAPENEMIEIFPGIPPMVKWSVYGFEPDWSGEMVGQEFLLKIAFEYTALLLGASVLDSEFDSFRRSLKDCSLNVDLCFEQGYGAPYKAHHGIAVTERYPYTVQIMLFGKLHYKLAFPRIHFGGKCISYHCDLESGKEDSEAIGPLSSEAT